MSAAGIPMHVPRMLLDGARQMMALRSHPIRGLWPRATALLTRQALEVALRTFWSRAAGGVEDASMRAQMLCLAQYVPAALTREAYQTWSALSRASHHHVYELSPTTEELATWGSAVERVIERLEKVRVR